MLLQIQRIFVHLRAMEQYPKEKLIPNALLLQSEELNKYILETSVYPREPKLLTKLRDATKNHPLAFFCTLAAAIQLMAMLLKLVNAKKTLEIGVFTGYSLLITALNIPDDGKEAMIEKSAQVSLISDGTSPTGNDVEIVHNQLGIKKGYPREFGHGFVVAGHQRASSSSEEASRKRAEIVEEKNAQLVEEVAKMREEMGEFKQMLLAQQQQQPPPWWPPWFQYFQQNQSSASAPPPAPPPQPAPE